MAKLLHTKALVNKDAIADSPPGVIQGVVGSSSVIDRMGDIIDQAGWNLKNFNTNPVILWGHNSGLGEDRPPIGKSLKTWIQDKGTDAAKLMFNIQFDLADKFAADIYRKVKEGYINTVSVGFLPTEWEELDPDNWFGGLKFLKQELLELSFVPVPANPEALVGMRSFAKKDKRFTPISSIEKLYPPVQNRKDLAEILDMSEDDIEKLEIKSRKEEKSEPDEEIKEEGKEEGTEEKDEKAQTINVDPDNEMDETGNITGGGNGGGGADDEIDDKPTGIDGETMLTDITAGDMRNEMNAAWQAMCEAMGTKAEGKDLSESGSGGDLVPSATMKVSDMTVAHHRALMQDVMGDWQSNLATTSNQGETEDVNNLAFDEKDTKEETLRKAQGLVTILKSGRVLSSKNEDRVRKAKELLESMLEDLEKEEVVDDAESGKDAKEEETKDALEDTLKGVIGYANHGKSPEDDSWDASAEMGKTTDPAVWKKMCTWFDSSKPDEKGSYKLPHHKGDGGNPSVWRGVSAAMAALMGARGGLDIPDGDRKGVYNHLVKHYEEYGKTPPDFKAVEDQVLAGFDQEINALMVNHSEKRLTKLINKVLENQKEEKRTVKIVPNKHLNPEVVGKATALVIEAFSIAVKANQKGGEK